MTTKAAALGLWCGVGPCALCHGRLMATSAVEESPVCPEQAPTAEVWVWPRHRASAGACRAPELH